MKWVAISLLLLNGILLALQLNKPKQTEQAVERFPFDGPNLVLLAEKEALDKANQSAAKNTSQSDVSIITAQPTTAAKVAPTPSPVPKSVVNSKSTAMACYSVGPFLLISDIKNVSQLFRRSAIITRERSEALRKQIGYWLYITPMASPQLAREALRQMQESDVSDAMIISEGSKANAISVGVYKTRNLARERQNLLAQLGYEAKVEPLFRTQPQYWLDLELMDLTQLPDRLWQEATADYPKIKQLRRKCG